MYNPLMSKNVEVTSYCVMKHGWKGNYKRLITIGTLGITTYHCETLKVTNQWPYGEICSLEPDSKVPRSGRFSLWLREVGNRNKKEMKFSTEFRVIVLTEALNFCQFFQEKPVVRMRINATKLRWNEKTVDVILEVHGHCVKQIDTKNQLISVYFYRDIDMITKISDLSYGFAIATGGFGRLHIFYTNQREDFITTLAREALSKVGHVLYESKEVHNQDYYIENRMGKYSGDEHITSHAEFSVQKLPVHNKNAGQPVQRLLCITETCLVERDPDTYILVTLRPLCDIFALVRDPVQPQKFTVEYVHEGCSRSYLSTDRDSCLASLLDGVRSSGNRDVCVKMATTLRWYRFGPLLVPVDEDVESQHMKLLQKLPGGMNFNEAVSRFNANIPYSGLLHSVTQDTLFAEKKEKLIKGALTALINREGNQSEISAEEMEGQFHALRRLVASKAGFQGFTNINKMRETLGRKVVVALRRNDEAVAHAAIDMINALIQPMHENYDIRQEQLNKASIMSSSKFLESLLDMFSLHVLRGTGALVISVMLDFLTFTICPPYCETSDGEYFDTLLKLVSDRGRVMFQLFHHPSMAIVKGAGLIMQALIDEAEIDVGDGMQKLALAEGALPQHLISSCFARNSDHRSLAFRQLNRQLLSLWVTGNPDAKELLKRVLPAGLTIYLDSSEDPPINSVDYLFVRNNLEMAHNHLMESQKRNNETIRILEKKIDSLLMHWRSKIGIEIKPLRDKDEKPVCLRKRRRRVRVVDNWRMFFYQFFQDHSRSNLIWNMKTREEFRDALEKEIVDFKRERDFCSHIVIAEKTEDPDNVDENSTELNDSSNFEANKNKLVQELLAQAAKVSWNYVEFKVIYQSLANEIRVGDYFLRLLLEEDERVSLVMQEKAARAALGGSSVASSPSAEKLSNGGDRPPSCSSGDLAASADVTPSVEEAPVADDGSGSNVEVVAGIIRIRQSYEFFHELYRRFLQYHKPEMRNMCLYAMSIVYGRCYREIGTVSDCELFISLLERTNHKTERDRIILLLEKLILDKKNIEILLDCGAVRVVIDLMTIAHLHVSRAHAPQQTNVIEAAKDARHREDEQYKEWFYQGANKQKLGPLSFSELCRQLAEPDSGVTAETRVWCQGLDQWRPLAEVPQARWMCPQLHMGTAVLTDSEVAAHCLSILIGIVRAYPSRDRLGGIIRPMARCRRQITQPALLSHIVQLLLTFDPVLVERVALLLNLVFDENPFRSRLYITGVFYFILMYVGCNLLNIAQFLKSNHTVQGIKNEESISQSAIVANSILGNMLPEAMICFLENHSSEEFAQVFLGEYDTPETIWNNEMRRFMIEKIACHLMEFSPRLPSNNRAIYQYLSIPIISYPQLDSELFCGSYYLRHLCDVARFPDWPIRNPISLLREILQAWKNEVEKKPPSMSIRDAYEILNLRVNENLPNDQASRTKEEGVIRKAYFQLSMKYHPDKNPDGRDMFDRINSAYQFLCNRAKLCSGPDPNNVILLLKSQSILFQRCKKDIANLKYSGYPMLIKTILAETEDDQLFQKPTPLLAACAELAYNTVGSSALNAEELRRQDGIQALQAGFSRCVAVITRLTEPPGVSAPGGNSGGDFAVRVCGYMSLFLSVAAQFEECRQRIHEIPQIARDLVRLLYFRNLPQLCCLVARCVADLSCEVWLQQSLFENGALFHLLSFVFQYDFTLEEGGVARSEENHKQETLNRLAVISLLAVARLCGAPNERNQLIQLPSPPNATARACVAALLTPYVQRKLAEFDGDPASLKLILKLINSNSETPYLLWDNRTRSELKTYAEAQQDGLIKIGECDSHFGADFKYSRYQKELIIGEIFVRIFNEQKGFVLENARSFIIDLLLFLKSETDRMTSIAGSVSPRGSPTEASSSPELTRLAARVQAAMHALQLLLQTEPDIGIQLIGHFRMLFDLMTYSGFPAIQEEAVLVVKYVTSNQECLEDIGASNVLVHLVRLLDLLPQSSLTVLDTISRMVSVTSLLKELVYKGCIMYGLQLFCAASHSEVRVAAAGLLGRMMADKLLGSRIRAILLQFMPLIFLDAMRDSPENCVHLYDNRHEHPELIWNDDTRQCLVDAVTDRKTKFFEDQSRDMTKKWSVPEEFRVPYESITNCGMCVAGVYLHLFVANPNWVLRSPDEFCNQLFSKWFEIIQSSSGLSKEAASANHDSLELVTDALARFLDSHAGTLDSLPRKGYVHKVFETLSTHGGANANSGVMEPVLKAGLLISHQMANSQLCVSAMASIDSIRPLLTAIRLRPDLMGLAGETLFRLFQSGSDELIGQAVRARLVEFVLGVLENGVVPGVKDAGQVKAYLVKALKAMQRSPTYGAQITTLLENSGVWGQFRDQSHDLYLTNTTQVAGYLTGGRSVDTAGYLTSASYAQQGPPRDS